jgi:hypothetical protein
MVDVQEYDPKTVPTPAQIAVALGRIPAATVLTWIVRAAAATGDTRQLAELARAVRARAGREGRDDA